ncbi:hypothetical protein ENHY17A_10086 [Moraxellaceae bacterium 17A]|nr:hypothetical protein ENHY17A_10086 [Moraxellaceae bacterium 17A]
MVGLRCKSRQLDQWRMSNAVIERAGFSDEIIVGHKTTLVFGHELLIIRVSNRRI